MTSRILISLAIAAVLLWGCEGARASRESSSQTPVRPVKTITLTSNTAPIPIEASGKVASGKEMHLAFKIGGVIERLSVSEGQQVRQGQVLGTLNLTEINARVAQAQNAMDKAERDLQRLQKLYGDSVITLEQLQDATTGAEVARAELEVATFNRQYARLVAPADGKVLRKFRESGELVSPGAPVLQLGTSDRAARIMRIGISDRDVVRLALGDTARLTFDAFPGQHFRAAVSEIGAAADPRSGVFEVELTLAPSAAPLKDGFIGRARLFPSQQPPYYRIPMVAMLEGSEHLVRILVPHAGEDGYDFRTVRPDFIGRDFFTVLIAESGVIPRVVTEGAAYVREGDALKIVQ